MNFVSSYEYRSNFELTLRRHLKDILNNDYPIIHRKFTKRLVERMLELIEVSPELTRTPIIDYAKDDLMTTQIGGFKQGVMDFSEGDLITAIRSCEFYGGVFIHHIESSRIPININDIGYKLAYFYDRASVNDSSFDSVAEYADKILLALRNTTRDIDIREYVRVLKEGRLSEEELRKSGFFNKLILDID